MKAKRLSEAQILNVLKKLNLTTKAIGLKINVAINHTQEKIATQKFN